MSTLHLGAEAGKSILQNPQAVAVISDSALKLFFGLQGGIFVQWMLEHIAINPVNDIIGYKTVYETVPDRDGLRRTITKTVPVTKRRLVMKWISTVETSNLNNTGLMPPILSNAARLADAGTDIAVASANLATESIKTQNQGGLSGSINKLLFGG